MLERQAVCNLTEQVMRVPELCLPAFGATVEHQHARDDVHQGRATPDGRFLHGSG